jgi:hypothetical protein
MMAEVESRILCGSCRADIEGPKDFTNESVFRCPECGQSDTYENIVKEAQAYFEDAVAKHFDKTLSKIARGSSAMTYTGSNRPTRSYRFILDPLPPVCTENLIRVDDAMESPKLAE